MSAQQCVVFFTQSMTTVIRCCLVDVPCLVLNAFTILCLARIIHEQSDSSSSNMFKYLLVKAVADFSIFASDVFNIRKATSEQMQTSFAGQVWYIYFFIYFQSSIYYVSSLMEIAATIDCWVSIKRKYKLLSSNTTFYSVVAFSIIFAFGFHIFEVFSFAILPREVNVTVGNMTVETTIYYQGNTDASQSLQVVFAIDAVIRDFAFLAIIVFFNILIFWELQKVTKRRIGMQEVSLTPGSVNNPSSMSTQHVDRAMRAQRSKAIMISLTGVNYLFGKLLFDHFFISNLYISNRSRAYRSILLQVCHWCKHL